MKEINIKILDKHLGDTFYLPQYATSGSVGLDLCACLSRPLLVLPGMECLVSAGIAIFIEDKNIAALILPRSGLGHYHGIILGNSIGLVDSDYQGPIMLSVWNRSKSEYCILPGERIAQIVFFSVTKVKFTLVTSFKKSNRGDTGFGYSGKF